MVVVSYSGKEINAKLVYYGPGLSGKTTNLEHIYQSVPATNRGKMVSMKTRTERTLFFDFLPVDLGEIGGFKTRFLLYTVPGQVYYNATRKLVLRGVDAVIFVADSGQGKMEENLESLENLRENLREYGLSLDNMPWVIQYNKRDLPNAYSIEELEAALNPGGVPSFEAVATTGDGVFECFRGTARILLQKLSQEIKLGTTKPSALTAPRPGESSETASGAPPPGLMSGATPSKGYRPPIPAAPKTGAVPPAVPHPPRPAAPPPPTPSSMNIERPSAAMAKPYRPPVPGQAPAPAAGPAPAPQRPEAPARPGASRIMPSPIPPPPPSEPVSTPSGASWFEEEAAPEPATAEEEAFAPSLDLEEDTPQTAFETGASWVTEAGTSEPGYETGPGYIETVREEESEFPEEQPLASDPRGDALARRFEAQEDTNEPSLSSLEEEEPGFWGRLFKRKSKDRADSEDFRRYPTADLSAPRAKRIPDLTPMESPALPPLAEPHIPAAPAARPVKAPQVPPVTMRRDLVKPTPRMPASEPVASWSEEPVTIERTVQIPVALGPEEARRGAILKLTLEIVIDASQSTSDSERAA